MNGTHDIFKGKTPANTKFEKKVELLAHLAWVSAVAFLLLLAPASAVAQAPDAKPAAGAPAAPPAPGGGGVSAADVAKSNNPLAPVTAVTFENYYDPTLYGVPNVNANTLDLRGVFIAGRQIIRLTVPVQTTPVGQEQYKSGLGDVAVFDAIQVSPNGARNEYAVGPLLVAPTATNTALGSHKWQGGVAAVGIFPLGGGSIMGVLATWQHSFAGDSDHPNTQVSTLQPFATYSIGSGFYVRSSGVMVFDIKNSRNLIPFGAGFGKTFKAGNHLVNAFIEPQFTVYHKGAGQPSFQLYMGIKWQWPQKKV
ncbi:MAG TPA: hypothetical protein VMG30_16110 [Acidobacteriota bacterium]|nr:hypothetical protein [Acidobacteriota bacterium]